MAIWMEKQFHAVPLKSWDELEWNDSKVESWSNKMYWLKWKIAVISSALLMLLATSCADKSAFENASDRFVQTEKTLKKTKANLAKENEDVKEAQQHLKKEKIEAETAKQEYIAAKKAHDDAKKELKKIVWWL